MSFLSSASKEYFKTSLPFLKQNAHQLAQKGANSQVKKVATAKSKFPFFASSSPFAEAKESFGKTIQSKKEYIHQATKNTFYKAAKKAIIHVASPKIEAVRHCCYFVPLSIPLTWGACLAVFTPLNRLTFNDTDKRIDIIYNGSCKTLIERKKILYFLAKKVTALAALLLPTLITLTLTSAVGISYLKEVAVLSQLVCFIFLKMKPEKTKNIPSFFY